MQTYKPLHIIAVLALIIAIMACASRRTASDELRSTATTTADAMAHQTHASVRTDTATAHTVSRDTVRQQTTTADTTAAHYRRATWQQADTTFTEVWVNARRFRYHDGSTASTASHKEARAATSTAVKTDTVRLISRTDTISAVQKKHEETDRRPLDRSVLGYIVYTAFVLIVVLLILLFFLGRRKN
jgi:cobalamin biosynthesis Mg chelatase CobN|nr:MAG TPA_asm: Mid2 like cell wall stress sensor [Caudoviricetes sp.]